MSFGRARVVACAAVMLAAACTRGGTKPNYSPNSVLSALRTLAPPVTATSRPSSRPSTVSTGPRTTGPNVRPGEKPPVLDPLGTQRSSAGALLFADYFIRVLDWSLATTDPYLVQRLSLPTCQACAQYGDRLGRLRKSGGYVRGGRITVNSTSIAAGNSAFKSDCIVQAFLTQDADTVVTRTAPPSTESTRASTSGLRLYLSWLRDHWAISEIGGS
jgi:Family of unknown function (DUF6318)